MLSCSFFSQETRHSLDGSSDHNHLKAQQGKDPLPRACGHWQDSILHTLLDRGPQFLFEWCLQVCLGSFLHGLLKHISLHHQSFQVKGAIEGAYYQDGHHVYDLITDDSSFLCSILCIRNKSWGLLHTHKGRESRKSMKGQEVGITGSHLQTGASPRPASRDRQGIPRDTRCRMLRTMLER